MAHTPTFPGTAIPRQDWRVAFGLASTALWLALGFMCIATQVGWSSFVSQPADALGGFLEGAFAPLAFLWLVIGSFLQQRELRTNNLAIQAQYAEMKRTAENSEIQAIAIRANALHQQQETTLMVADRVHNQLGAIVGMLWMSAQTAGNEGEASVEQVEDLWARLGSGDPEGFARQFMALYFRNDRDAVRDLLFGTEIRAVHSRTIVEIVDRLLESIRRCDPDGLLESTLLGSGHGRLYTMIREHDPHAAEVRA